MSRASYWIKVDRALDHIDALDRSIKAWLDSDAYTITKEIKEEGGNEQTSFIAHIPDPLPDDWSPLIGDAVHNLRSALDHIALALNAKGYADANNGAFLPVRAETAFEFPIIGDENADGKLGEGAAMFHKAATRRLREAPAGAVAAIDLAQPYKRGKDFRDHPLWLVFDLDRVDKHRKLVAAGAATPASSHQMQFHGLLIEATLGWSGPVHDQLDLAHWIQPIGTPEPDHQVRFVRGVAFDEGMPGFGMPVVKTLRRLRDYLRADLLPALERFL